MAGHSKFKNIMHRKGAQDKKRAKLFSRLIREISVSSKLGSPDPTSNPRLRAAINNALSSNMTKDTIDKAIKKNSVQDDKNSIEEITYEGFGPSGIAIIVESMTDNKNRSASEIRSTISKNNGNLGISGSVRHYFKKVGFIDHAFSHFKMRLNGYFCTEKEHFLDENENDLLAIIYNHNLDDGSISDFIF